MKYLFVFLLLTGCSKKTHRPILINVNREGNYTITIPDELKVFTSLGDSTSVYGEKDTINKQWIITLQKINK